MSGAMHRGSIDTIPIAMTWLVMKEISFGSWSNMFRSIRCRFLFVFSYVLSKCGVYAEACWYSYFHGKKQLDLKGWGICMTAWPTKNGLTWKFTFERGWICLDESFSDGFQRFIKSLGNQEPLEFNSSSSILRMILLGAISIHIPKLFLQRKGDRIMAKSSALAGNRFRTVKHWATNLIFRWF